MNNEITEKEMQSIVASPFIKELQDKSRQFIFNGKMIPIAYYNLIVSIRDLKLYDKGLRPHRNWKISDVKKYFGLKGSASKMVVQLEALKKTITYEKV